MREYAQEQSRTRQLVLVRSLPLKYAHLHQPFSPVGDNQADVQTEALNQYDLIPEYQLLPNVLPFQPSLDIHLLALLLAPPFPSKPDQQNVSLAVDFLDNLK